MFQTLIIRAHIKSWLFHPFKILFKKTINSSIIQISSQLFIHKQSKNKFTCVPSKCR